MSSDFRKYCAAYRQGGYCFGVGFVGFAEKNWKLRFLGKFYCIFLSFDVKCIYLKVCVFLL